MNLEGLCCCGDAQTVFMWGREEENRVGGVTLNQIVSYFFTHDIEAVIFMSSPTKLHPAAAFDVALPGVLP